MRKKTIHKGFFIAVTILILLGTWLGLAKIQHLTHDSQQYKLQSDQYKTQNDELKKQLKKQTGASDTLRLQLNQLEREAGESANLHAYFQKRRSPLSGYALYMLRSGRRHGVDPALLGAIAMAESGGCRQFIFDTHNCWGWGSGHIYFSGYAEGIDTIAAAIGEGKTYRRYQETRDIRVFAKIYNPGNWEAYAQTIEGFIQDIKNG